MNETSRNTSLPHSTVRSHLLPRSQTPRIMGDNTTPIGLQITTIQNTPSLTAPTSLSFSPQTTENTFQADGSGVPSGIIVPGVTILGATIPATSPSAIIVTHGSVSTGGPIIDTASISQTPTSLATSPSNTALTITSTSIPSSTASGAQNQGTGSGETSGGLDTNGKIGIGVAVGIGIPLIALLTVIAVLLYRSARRQNPNTQPGIL